MKLPELPELPWWAPGYLIVGAGVVTYPLTHNLALSIASVLMGALVWWGCRHLDQLVKELEQTRDQAVEALNKNIIALTELELNTVRRHNGAEAASALATRVLALSKAAGDEPAPGYWATLQSYILPTD